MSKIPYTKIYTADWLAWRRKLSPETLCKILDVIADYCIFGDKPEVKPEDNPQVIEVLTTLMKWAKECEKAYLSNLEKGRRGGRPKSVAKKPEVKPEDKLGDKPEKNLGAKQPETYTEIKEDIPVGISKKDDPINWDDVLKHWNELAEKWNRPKVLTLNNKRKTAFKARMTEYKGTVADLFATLDYRLATSLTLHGKQMNRYGELEDWDWSGIDFDFLCQPSKFFKILEGGYRDAGLEKKYAIQQQLTKQKEQGEKDEHELFMQHADSVSAR